MHDSHIEHIGSVMVHFGGDMNSGFCNLEVVCARHELDHAFDGNIAHGHLGDIVGNYFR